MNPPPGTFRDLVVIGASAGGVEALRELVKRLPVDLPAAVLVVLHLPARGTSVLGSILDAAGPLPAEPAQHGVPIEHGHLYVAPPDHHLLVEGDCLVLSDAPTESGHRPAINALFRSAALARGPLVAGVVLSGVLDDGAAGLAMIKSYGGLAIVQDPGDAAYRGMPDSALAGLAADHVLTAREIGEQLSGILAVPVELAEAGGPGAMLRYERTLARNEPEESMPHSPESAAAADTAGLFCPDCGRELSMQDQEAFRCQAGHAWTADALLATADHRMQAALWTALKALDEKTVLTRQMEGTARDRGSEDRAGRYSASGQETDAAARLIRARLTSGPPGGDKDGDTA